MSNQDRKSLDEFPNESVAEITEMARAKIERMLLKKYGKSLGEFRVYHRHKFPYLVVAKLKDGTYKMLALQ
jgi:hypothetical protein